jgi:hypothetical protein
MPVISIFMSSLSNYFLKYTIQLAQPLQGCALREVRLFW